MAIAAVDGRRWCCRGGGGVGGCLNWRWWVDFLVMFPVCWTGRVCGTVGGLALGGVTRMSRRFGTWAVTQPGNMRIAGRAVPEFDTQTSRFKNTF